MQLKLLSDNCLLQTAPRTAYLRTGWLTCQDGDRAPDGARAVQQARNLAMGLGDRPETLRFLIHDRDPLFAAAFGEVFKSEGLRIITTLPRTPRMNATCEGVIEPSAVSSWTGSRSSANATWP